MSLRRNGIFSAAEVIVNGSCLFLIYRHVVDVLGVSMLGVWGLVLSTTAFGRAADLGISGGLARFVARSVAEGAPAKAVLYMRTGVMFMAVAMGGLVLALWWPLWLCLDFALDGNELDAARGVLPWAILSVWLLMVKSALDSCLLGVHRADLRSIAGISGMSLQLVASFALVQGHGLHGLAWAQAGQFALAIAMEVTFLMTLARVDSAGVREWFSGKLFKEMLGFGMTLQLGTLGTLLFEPLAKSVLGAVAGTHALGIFEIAYRTTYQVKNVATMALQPTVPVLSELAVRGDGELPKAFRRVCTTASVMTAVLMSVTALVSPVLSWLFLGEVDRTFVITAALMCVTWAPTILAAPSYYLGLATGRVWPYVGGEFLAVFVAPIMIFALGSTKMSVLAVLGVLCGKAVGSAMPAILNRPTPAFRDSAIANRHVLSALACVAVVGGSTAVVAGVWL